MKRLLLISLLFSVEFLHADDAILQQHNKDYLLHKQQIEQLSHSIVPFIQSVQSSDPSRRPWLEQEDICFKVDAIDIISASSNSDIDTQQFYPILKLLKYSPDGVIGRCIGENGLSGVVNYLNEQLVEIGYVSTQVILTEQDLSSGHLQLQLVPGRIGQIRIKNTENRQLYYRFPFTTGEILNIRDLEQTLEKFSRLQGTSATFDIVPSNTESNDSGYSDIVISWERSERYFFNAGMNNTGSKSSGKYQASASYSLENPLGFLDKLFIYHSHSINDLNQDHTDFNNVFVSYEVPWRDWLFSINASQYRNTQELEGFDEWLDYKTINRDVNLKLEREISRTKFYRFSGYGQIYRKAASSFIEEMEIEVQKKRTAGWETGVNHHLQLGQKSLDTQFSVRKGTGLLGAIETAEDFIGTGNSRATVWNTSIQYSVPWVSQSNQYIYQMNVQAQWSPDAVISQESFSIGSLFNIRAYRSDNSLVGNNGYFVQQTIHWLNPLPYVSFYMGIDYGGVNGEGTQYYSDRQLLGAIAGIRNQFKYFNGDFFIGKGITAPQHIKKDLITGFNLSFNF